MLKGFKWCNNESSNTSTAISLHGVRLATPTNKTSKSSFNSFAKAQESTINNQQDIQIYFNHQKRKIYFHKIIDNYFEPQKLISPTHNSLKFIEISPIARKQIQSSKSTRKKYQQVKYYKKVNLQNKSIRVCLKEAIQNTNLTIIEEAIPERRPFSQNKRTRIHLSQRDIAESMVFQDKSVYDISDRFVHTENRLSQKKTVSTPKKLELDDTHNWKSHMPKKSAVKVDKTKGLNSKNNQELARQIRIRRLGMQVLWKMGQNERSLQFPVMKSLKDLCYCVTQEGKGPQALHLIHPTKYYYNLFANDNQQLKDIIISIAKVIRQQKQMISNCQINLEKIVKIKEKEFRPMDWGSSASKEELVVQGRKFSNFTPPLIKLDDQWLVAPQYLAPQMLRAHLKGCYNELWQQKGGISACDIWSLGIGALVSQQFLSGERKKFKKKGFSWLPDKISPKHFNKAKKPKGFWASYFEKWVVSNRIMSLLPLMLEQSVSKRVTAEQIIKILS